MAADKPKNSKKEPGVMDITKPGKQAPPSTSKPVIVGHRPMVADPMVKDDKAPAEESDSEEHKITVTRVGPKVIAPLSDGEKSDDKTDDKPAEDSEDKPEESTEEKPSEEDDKVDLKEEEPEEAPPYIIEDQNAPEEKSEDKSDEKSDDKEEEKTEEKDDSEEKSDDEPKDDESKADKSDEKSDGKPAEASDAAVVDAVADQAGSKKKEVNAETEEEKQKREEIEKLIEDKKYYVPTSVVTKKRRTRWLFVFLILLVFGLVSYVMVDASTNTKLPYEFFKDEAAKDSVATDLPATVTTPTTQPDAEKEAYLGVVTKSSKGAFSIKIPNGWKLIGDKAGDFFVIVFDTQGDSAIDYNSSQKPEITYPEAIGFDGPVRFEAVAFNKTEDTSSWVNPQATKTTFTTAEGVKGTRYYYKHPVEPLDGIGPMPGQMEYVYKFEKGDKVVIVAYSIFEKNQYTGSNVTKNDENRLELVDNVVKTLKIN